MKSSAAERSTEIREVAGLLKVVACGLAGDGRPGGRLCGARLARKNHAKAATTSSLQASAHLFV